MSWLQRLFGTTAGSPKAASRTVVNPTSVWDYFYSDSAQIPVPTEQTAFQLSAIYACCNLIAGAIAALPMHIYRVDQNGDRNRTLTDDVWWILNEEFSPRWSAAAAWEYMGLSLLLHGDAFARIWRGPNAQPIEIEPVHPSRVTVALDYARRRLVYTIEPEAGTPLPKVVLDQDDVIHVAGFGFNGFRGMSPLRYSLRMASSVAMAAQDFSASFYANSARPDYVLQSEQKLGPEAIEQLRTQIEQRHQGTGKAFRPMVLQGGIELKPITMPMADMELLATRQFQIEEIARVYGVPPFMIGHNDKTTSWGSGVAEMGQGFVRFALRQHLNKFETELNRKLFRTAARRAEFDTFDLERADMKTMFEGFRVALGRAGEPGWMTAQEIRTRLNLKREPDGNLNTGATDAPRPAQPPAP
jgi:HK97 family phage portal protein